MSIFEYFADHPLALIIFIIILILLPYVITIALGIT